MKKVIFITSLLILIAIVITSSAILIPSALWNARRSSATLHGENSQPVMSYSDQSLRVRIESPQGFVYCVSDDTIIFTKGESKVVYPGSTTKLLTALYSLTVLSEDDIITPSDELDLVKLSKMTFFAPDTEVFPLLALAKRVIDLII